MCMKSALVLGWLVLAFVAGCVPATISTPLPSVSPSPQATLTPPPTYKPATASSGDAIDQAEHKWQAQGIRSYRIQVLHLQSIWHAQTYSITVRNERVIDQSAFCVPAPSEAGQCTVRPFKAEDYTVPGLFAIARTQAGNAEGKWTKITFDPIYGFPSGIAFDNPQVYDDDTAWSVKSFAVLGGE